MRDNAPVTMTKLFRKRKMINTIGREYNEQKQMPITQAIYDKILTLEEKRWLSMAPYFERLANVEVLIVINKERYEEAQDESK